MVIAGTLRSIQEFDMDHEILTHEEIRKRYPMMQADEDEIGLFESDAGYLNPELCVHTHLKLAEELGAELHFQERLLDYRIQLGSENDDDTEVITVSTDRGEYRARKLLLTVGAWAPQIYGAEIASMLTLHVERRVLCWLLPTHHREEFKVRGNIAYYVRILYILNAVCPCVCVLSQQIPVYIWDLGSRGNFYGFPEQAQFAASGVKVAFHSVREGNGEEEGFAKRKQLLRPEDVQREVTDEDIDGLREVLQRKMPALNGELLETATCMYTMTPDEHL